MSTCDGAGLPVLTELMGGARGLAQRVWDAGWRPPAQACPPCRLAAWAMAVWHDDDAEAA